MSDISIALSAIWFHIVGDNSEFSRLFPKAWQAAAQLVIEGVLSFEALDTVTTFAEDSAVLKAARGRADDRLRSIADSDPGDAPAVIGKAEDVWGGLVTDCSLRAYTLGLAAGLRLARAVDVPEAAR
jgi:hypothetical protein